MNYDVTDVETELMAITLGYKHQFKKENVTPLMRLNERPLICFSCLERLVLDSGTVTTSEFSWAGWR